MVNFLRKTWLTLSLILLCTGVHAATYNGTSGGTNWTVDTETGVLTISKGAKDNNLICPDYDAGVTHDYDTEWESDGYGVRCEKGNGDDWHKYSSQITSIVVEEGVTEIGNAAFRNLSNVTSVSLPTTLTTIGLEAFRGCSKLDSIYIPKNVCTLKDRWATDCYELSVIEIDPENQCYFVDQYGAVYDADTTTLVKLPQDMTIGELAIPEGVTEFATDALYQQVHLTQVMLPSSMTSVKYGSLDGLENLESIYFNSTTPPAFENEIGNGTNKNLVIYIPCLPEDDGRDDEYQAETGIKIDKIKSFLKEIEVYAVSGNAKAGSATVISRVTCEQQTVTISATTNPGYDFSHWESDMRGKIGEKQPTFTYDYIEGTHPKVETFTAIFKGRDFTLEVITDPSGMGVTTGSGNYEIDTRVNISVTPANDCYKFLGWKDDMTNDSLTRSVLVEANHKTYVALFEKDSFDVSASVNDANMGSVVMFNETLTKDFSATDKVCCNDSITLTATPAAHHHFVNWNGDANMTQPVYGFRVDGNKEVNANFAIDTFRVEFVNYDGTSLYFTYVDYGAVLPAYKGENPVRPATAEYSYSFNGKWMPAVASVTQDTIIVAQYDSTPINYNFKAIANGKVHATRDIAFDSSVVAPSDATKIGHTFVGWSDDDQNGNMVDFPFDMPAKDTIVYAVFKVDTFTLYYMDFDSTIISSEKVAYGDHPKIQPADPKREGYSFTGWSKIASQMPAANDTIFALYAIKEYTLSLIDYNEETIKQEKYDYNTSFDSFEEPSRTGYTFSHWVSEADEKIDFPFVLKKDSTLRAQYTVNQYELTFVFEGDSVISRERVDYGSKITAPTVAKEGYTFAGWDGVVPATMPAKDTTFTAKWTVNQYTITFNTDGGNEIAPITQDFGTAVEAPADPTREGYTFDGWDGEIPVIMPANDTTFTAKWTINSHVLTFKKNETEVISSESVVYGIDVVAPESLDSVGYTFTGWDIEVPATMPDADVTAVAQWTINSYELTFKKNETEVIKKESVDYNTPLADYVPAVDSLGYTFSGWSPAVAEKMPAEAATYVAQWTVNQYTITFDTDGGAEIAPMTQAYNSEIVAPENPTKVGYTFAGWSPEIPEKMPIDGITVKAQWTINSHILTFKKNDTEVLSSESVVYGTAIVKPEVSDSVGYTFTGWDIDVPATMPDKDVTAVAQWTVNAYELTFKYDEDSVISTGSVDYKEAITAPADPTKEGYTFAGWGGEVPATMPAKDTTFTAQWSINQYTITFNTEGGSAIAPITQDFGTAVVSPADPTREGYTFAGWDGTIPATMPAKDSTFTAQWNINQYTLTFKKNDEEVISSEKYDYGHVFHENEMAQDPDSVGYSFMGWSPELPTKMPAEDFTTTAQWKINSYKISFYGDLDNRLFHEVTVEYGSDLEDIINEAVTKVPVVEGETFEGWNQAIPETMPANNLNIYALYSANTYYISWLDYNGTVLEKTPIIYGNKIGTNSDLIPTREGYEFVKWNYKNGEEVNFGTDVYSFDHDTAFVAQYDILQYTITFDTDGGTVIESITEDFGTTLSPVSTTKEGHTFLYWVNAASEQRTDYPAAMPAKNLDLKAVWSVNQYIITFNTNGGNKIAPITQDFGTAVEAPSDPTKEGYTFAGWDGTIPATMPAKDSTLNAKWTINSHVLTFKKNETEVISSENVVYGTAVVEPESLDSVGYTFAGWDIEVPATMPDADVTAVAQWSINSYELTFKKNETDVIKKESVDYNTPLADYVPAVDSVGHTFNGWSPAVAEKMPAEAATYVAQWTVNPYTITFDTDGGTEIAPMTQAYNSEIVAPENPTKVGYTFAGWSPEIPEKMPIDGITVKAQWTINSHILTFKKNETEVISTENMEYGTAVVEPESLDSVGYTFTGWDIDVPATMPDKDVTAIAQWSINSYNLKFIGFKDAVLVDDYVDYKEALGGYVPTLVNPEGWTFTGWTPEVPTAMPAEDLTITSTWERNENDLIYIVDQNQTKVPYKYEDLVQAPESPSKEGHTFVSWVDGNGQKVDFGFSMPDNDTIVTAKWVVDTFAVTYVDHDGVVLGVDSVIYGGTEFKTIAEPTREGYEFIGWSDTLEVMPAEDVTIEAQYEILSFTMKFYIADNVLHRTVEAKYGTIIPSVNIPAREGYKVIGWDKPVPAKMPAYNDEFHAVYEVIPYVITYLDFDSDTLGTDTVNYGEPITAPANPVREGYTFAQWFGQIPATMPARNVTCIAQYQINQYNITFEDFDGRVISSKNVDYGTKVTSPANPVREGYTFAGWDNEVPSSMPAEDVVLKAEYEINSYVVSFVDFDNTILQTNTLEFGSEVVYPVQDPTREGYTFIGWSDSITTVPAKDSELKAKYAINQYNITFKDIDGNVIETMTLDFGAKVTAPVAPAREGYSFAGWDTTVTTMPAKDVVVNAEYVINNYVAKYKDYDNSVITSFEVAFNAAIPAVENPTREGYTFSGWLPVVPDKMPAKNFETTAQYTVNKYTFVFRDKDDELITRLTTEYGKDVIAPQAPVEEGHVFIGWDKEVPAKMPAYNDIFKAKYKVLRYSLTFMDKESGTIYQTDSLDYGEKVVAPTAPEKVGYTFAGWDIDVPSVMPNVNIIIYATWGKNAYALSYYDVDSTLIQTDSVLFEDEVVAMENPSREGYTFAGWEPALPSVMPAEDVETYATYIVNKYQITFVDENDNLIHSDSVAYGDAITLPSAPVKEGYTFAGWAPNVPATMPAEDVKVKATWAKNFYTITFVDFDNSVILEEQLEFDEKIVTPNAPSREGYTFVGWSPVVPKTMPSKNVVFTATYKANMYEITFLDDNDNVIAQDSLAFGDKIVAPAAPVKEGYEFSGWNVELPETMPAKDIVAKPNWNELAIVLKSVQSFTSNLCEGDDAQIEFTHEGGKPLTYKIFFGEDAVAAGFPEMVEGEIDEEKGVFFTLPSLVEEGAYTASLQLMGASVESNKVNFNFSTNLSSSHLKRMWNDVIVCSNVDERFTAYQWYKDGELIEGATQQFYCELDGLDGVYSVKVTSNDGMELFICGLECEFILPPFSIVVYPNPAEANEDITLEVEGMTEEDLANAKIFVYNASGVVAHSNKEVEFKNLVQLPIGSYIAVVELEGKTAFCKFIVR